MDFWSSQTQRRVLLKEQFVPFSPWNFYLLTLHKEGEQICPVACSGLPAQLSSAGLRGLLLSPAVCSSRLPALAFITCCTSAVTDSSRTARALVFYVGDAFNRKLQSSLLSQNARSSWVKSTALPAVQASRSKRHPAWLSELSGAPCPQSAAGSWWTAGHSHRLLRYQFTDLGLNLMHKQSN